VFLNSVSGALKAATYGENKITPIIYLILFSGIRYQINTHKIFLSIDCKLGKLKISFPIILSQNSTEKIKN
jgi:hypothetical protein